MVPEGWARKRADKVLDRVSRPVDVKPDQQYQQIGIRSHGKGLFDKEHVSGTELGDKRVFWVEPECFIVNIVFAWEQAVGVTSNADIGKIASHRFPMFRPKPDQCDIRFIDYFFKTPQGKFLLGLASPGGAGRNKTLGQKEFDRLELTLPPLPEQQKIVEILGTWDKAIETTEALLANARTQKRALMQSLLTGTRRFPGFEDRPWREVRLGDVVAGIPGGGTPDKGNPSFWGGDLPWVSVKDLKSTVLTQTQDTITEAGLSSSATNAFPTGTIVMATRMAVGSCAILGSRMAINQDLKAIIPNDLILNRYLFHCLQMSQDALATLGTGSTVKGITLDVLRELRIGLPGNKNEQVQISDAIDCAEHEVSALQSDLDHLRTEKKSLMQQLLTGKRRVVV